VEAAGAAAAHPQHAHDEVAGKEHEEEGGLDSLWLVPIVCWRSWASRGWPGCDPCDARTGFLGEGWVVDALERVAGDGVCEISPMSKRAPYLLLALGLVLVNASCAVETQLPPGGTGGAGVNVEGTGGAPGTTTTIDSGSRDNTPDGRPQARFPAELVGDWEYAGSILRALYSFDAQGGYVYASRLDVSSGCIVIAAIELTESGRVEVAGERITFVPRTRTNVETDCVGHKKPQAVNLDPKMVAYRLVAGSPPTLELIGEKTTTAYKKKESR
jgi:hypothetical protein